MASAKSVPTKGKELEVNTILQFTLICDKLQ